MIENIRIKNFKSLRNVDLSLKKINILYGINGMGKSSFIQVLLLLQQSFNQRLLPEEGLSLNGSLIKLGTGKDVFCESGNDLMGIEFNIISSQKKYLFHFEYSPSLSNANVLPLKKTEFEITEFLPITYLSSHRIAPRPFYETSDYEVNQKRNLGIRGEYVAQFLAEFENFNVTDIRKHINAKSNRLLENVECWLDKISPGIKLTAYTDNDTGIAKIRFSYREKKVKTREFKPSNVGFGLTHLLPIIVGLLTAESNSIVIIENPESHIHPKGQEIISELFIKAALDDVQLIVESHSNEIIQSLKHYATIEKVEVSLNYFSRSIHEHVTEVEVQDLQGIGDIKHDSFFSTSQINMEEVNRELSSIKKTTIITEGKTDWKLLKYALKRLQNNNLFRDLDIRFYEFEHGDMGESELKRFSKSWSGFDNTFKTILLFDRDKPPFDLKSPSLYRNKGTYIYEAVLPIPKFRKGNKNICIEHFFENDVIKLTCKEGRRLFLSSEFLESGRLREGKGISMNNGKLIEKYLTEENEIIIDSSKAKVFNQLEESICISKNDFCERIISDYYKLTTEKFSAFEKIFEIIREIDKT